MHNTEHLIPHPTVTFIDQVIKHKKVVRVGHEMFCFVFLLRIEEHMIGKSELAVVHCMSQAESCKKTSDANVKDLALAEKHARMSEIYSRVALVTPEEGILTFRQTLHLYHLIKDLANGEINEVRYTSCTQACLFVLSSVTANAAFETKKAQ